MYIYMKNIYNKYKEKERRFTMKIVLCITGSIAAYKSASLVSFLKNRGDEVQVIITENTTKFISPLTFQTLSKRKVIASMFDEQDANFVGHKNNIHSFGIDGNP